MPCSGPRSTPAAKSASACAAAASAVSSKRATYVPNVASCASARAKSAVVSATLEIVPSRNAAAASAIVDGSVAVHCRLQIRVGRQVRGQEARCLRRVQRVGRRPEGGVHLDHRFHLVVGRADPRRREQRPHRCTVICGHRVPHRRVLASCSRPSSDGPLLLVSLTTGPPRAVDAVDALSMRCRCDMAHLWHSTTARTGGERTAPDRLKWWLTSENVDAQGRLALPVAGS